MIRYLEHSIENMRDIGGYKSELGNRVKIGRLVRSNLPQNLSSNDISFLNKMGIDTIIDLRSQEEIETRKSIFENNKKIANKSWILLVMCDKIIKVKKKK